MTSIQRPSPPLRDKAGSIRFSGGIWKVGTPGGQEMGGQRNASRTMTFFSVENTKSVNLVLTPYRNSGSSSRTSNKSHCSCLLYTPIYMTAATTSRRGSIFLPSDIQDDMYSPAFRLLSGCFFHMGRRTRTENREILSHEVSASRKPMRLSLLCLTSCFLDTSLNTMICLPRDISEAVHSQAFPREFKSL